MIKSCWVFYEVIASVLSPLWLSFCFSLHVSPWAWALKNSYGGMESIKVWTWCFWSHWGSKDFSRLAIIFCQLINVIHVALQTLVGVWRRELSIRFIMLFIEAFAGKLACRMGGISITVRIADQRFLILKRKPFGSHQVSTFVRSFCGWSLFEDFFLAKLVGFLFIYCH